MISPIGAASAVSDPVSVRQKLVLLVALILVSARAVGCITVELVVIADAKELREFFNASARKLPDSLEVNLTAAAGSAKFGSGYSSCSLKVLPVDLVVEKLTNEHWALNGTTTVTNTRARSVRFSVPKEQVRRAFVVMHFGGPGSQGEDKIEVLIPYAAFQALLTEKKDLYPLARAPDLARTDFLAELRGNLPN
ncbi:MAG: hypothetical protein ABIO94_13455 [Opitutaceae bacterium]